MLSFPVDGPGAVAGPRELGDVVICPAHTTDLQEAVVHGVLHLAGYDHESDQGEMLALQDDVMGRLRGVTRSGFIAVAGRPNVGKSTLVNALVGAKVAVTSDKPQTTRRAIRGIVNGAREGDAYQLVLVDLPGVQSPRDELTERMQRRVERELADCDAALFVVNAAERSAGGDRFIAAGARRREAAGGRGREQGRPRRPRQDRRDARRVRGAGAAKASTCARSCRSPRSRARESRRSRKRWRALLPEGPFYFPADEVSDQPLNVRLAELVREAALKLTREEVPHSIEVHVEDVIARDDGLTVVRAVLWVESASQKSILIGRAAAWCARSAPPRARRSSASSRGRAHLDLTVKVRKGWRRDEGLLDRLGIEA